MTSPAPTIDPKRTALLVMDFQHGVVERMPGLDSLLARVQQAITDVRDHGGTIAYVRVAFTEADWAAIPPTNAIFSRVGENHLMHDEDRSTAIDDRLAPQPGDIVVRKTRVGAMSTTDLDRQLRDRGHRYPGPGRAQHQRRRAFHARRGGRPRLPAIRPVRWHRRPRRRGPRRPAGQGLPAEGAGHRDRRAPHPAAGNLGDCTQGRQSGTAPAATREHLLHRLEQQAGAKVTGVARRGSCPP